MSAFALENFAPADVRFKLRRHKDREFVVDGDRTVDEIADMLRIEEALDAPAASDKELLDVAREARDLLLGLIQERDPSVTTLNVSPREIMIVLCLILRGPNVAAIVAETILGPARPDGEGAPFSAFEHDARDDGEPEDGDAAPLASANGSPASSSSSDELDAGLPAIGTA